MIDWMLDWILDWIIDKMLDQNLDWMIDWMIDKMLDWIIDWMIDQMLDTYTGPGPASSYKSPTISWIILYIKKKTLWLKLVIEKYSYGRRLFMLC